MICAINEENSDCRILEEISAFVINYKAGEYRRISASARRQAASHPSAPRAE